MMMMMKIECSLTKLYQKQFGAIFPLHGIVTTKYMFDSKHGVYTVFRLFYVCKMQSHR